MPTTIADIIEPTEFAAYVLELSSTKSRVFSSGVANFNEFNAEAQAGGQTVHMPFWNDLDDADSAIDNDTGAPVTPDSPAAREDTARVHDRNKSIAAADLAATVAGSDPLGVLANRFVAYWDRDYQRHMIQSGLGLLADNVANDAGDMVYNVATNATGAPTPAELMSADTVIEGAQTMGDSKEDLAMLITHSRVHANLQKQGALQDHFNLETNALEFQTMMGFRVVVDDGMPAVAGTNHVTYTSMLVAGGAFGHGEGTPHTPVESDRNGLANNGGGEEWLLHRRRFIMHPRGIRWTNASVAGKSPTRAELANAANWDRVYARKAVKLAFIQTNG